MNIAALCLGIAAFAMAALMTAPFFFWLALLGVPLAVAGIIASVAAFIHWVRSRRARRPLDPGFASHAAWGLLLSLVALAWQGVLVKLWADLTM